MSEIDDLLDRFRSRNASWDDYSLLLKLEEENLLPFFELAQEIKSHNFGNELKIYIPDKRFPSISITGNSCALHCEHCNEKYLKGMRPITKPLELEDFLLQHSQNEGIGVLISGGCDLDGSVPLINYLDIIKKVKNQTNLIINTHAGLLNEETARKLSEANVDIISFDINMDEEIIKEIYHLDASIDDYKNAVELLKKNDLNIIPHICIGLYHGKLHKELESIKFIKESGINPELIVLIALIPPKNTQFQFERPEPNDIAKVIATIRFIFPDTEISLGCMRPRGNVKVEIEKKAIKAGITRIEIPSRETIKWANIFNPKIKLRFFSACCAISKRYEAQAESKKSDIKRYLDL